MTLAMKRWGHTKEEPLVLLHGFMGSAQVWEPIAKTLSKHTPCIAFDLPGHGASPLPPETLQLDTIAQQICRTLTHNAIEHFKLLGYSMGGRVALAMTHCAPERCKLLIIENANPGLTSPADRENRRKLDAKRAAALRQHGMEPFLERWYNAGLFASLQQRPALLAQLKGLRLQNNPQQMAQILEELSPGHQRPMWDDLPQLPMQTLLITGASDTKYTEISARMAQQLPNATRWIAPNAGHNVHAEVPKLFVKAVAGALGHPLE